MTIPQETAEMAEEVVSNDATADDELEEFFAKKSRAKKGKKKKANVRLEDIEEELELQAAQEEIEEDPQLALMLHRMDMKGQKPSSPEEKPRDTQPVVVKQWGQPVMVATSVEDVKFVPRAKKQLDVDDPKAFPSIGDAPRVEEILKREAREAAERKRIELEEAAKRAQEEAEKKRIALEEAEKRAQEEAVRKATVYIPRALREKEIEEDPQPALMEMEGQKPSSPEEKPSSPEEKPPSTEEEKPGDTQSVDAKPGEELFKAKPPGHREKRATEPKKPESINEEDGDAEPGKEGPYRPPGKRRGR